MKNTLLLLTTLLFASSLFAQKLVEKKLSASTGDMVNLDFRFADNIKIIVWDKSEVLVKASANLNNNEDNDLFEMTANKSGNDLKFLVETDHWEKRWKDRKNGNCNYEMDIFFEVYMPRNLDVEVETLTGSIELADLTENVHLNTVSGDITLKAPSQAIYAKTISGDIEMLVPGNRNLDFSAQTVTGEIFSNLEIEFLDGKEGLRQIVGQKIRGRLQNGGGNWAMETISGNIYLREI